MAKKRKRKKSPGPCPDPERYSLVSSKECDYWRLNRGLKKTATLNDVLARNTENVQLASPFSKRLVKLLEPHLRGLQTGRLTSRITGKLVTCINKTGRMDLSALENFEFQKDRPLSSLLNAGFSINVEEHSVVVRLYFGNGPVEKHNELVTECFFDLILVSGDPQEPRSLRIDGTSSQLFKIHYSYSVNKIDYIMSLDLPTTKSWILLFKVSCLEGNELAAHPRNYGMKVVRVGSGE